MPEQAATIVAIAAVAPVAGASTAGTTAVQPGQSPPVGEHAITLTQFGIELSRSEKRVELLNAFIFMESQAARFKDTKPAYLARFDAFVHQPVAKG